MVLESHEVLSVTEGVLTEGDLGVSKLVPLSPHFGRRKSTGADSRL